MAGSEADLKRALALVSRLTDDGQMNPSVIRCQPSVSPYVTAVEARGSG